MHGLAVHLPGSPVGHGGDEAGGFEVERGRHAFHHVHILYLPLVGNSEPHYHAAFFDRLMGQTQASTARQVEKGVADRIASRASRPSENGNRPGGAAVVKTDISHMTRAEREDLERRVRRGEKIEL